MDCPKCGGETYDNRQDKAAGTKNAKWPDFKCKDKVCNWAQWPEKAPGQGSHKGGARAPSGPKWSWGSLKETYRRSLLLSAQLVPPALKGLGIAPTSGDVLNGAATLFIAVSRDGVQADAAPKKEVAEDGDVPF